jgi:flagellar basal-body rod modification protein FlgD
LASNVQNTLSTIQNNTNQINFENSRKNLGNSRLDRESFIRLILTQLENQDPTNPQDSTQMLSQQLQLEQVDQMQDVVHATAFSRGSALVGQYATLPKAPWDFKNNISGNPEIDAKTNTPKMLTGLVKAVQFDPKKGTVLVQIGNDFYDMNSIKQVSATPPEPPVTTPPTTTGS